MHQKISRANLQSFSAYISRDNNERILGKVLMSKRDYYEVLGVSRTATDQELKSAYRALAQRYHPDKNQNDASAEEKFKELGEAYGVLADPDQRKRYDSFGHAG